MAVDNGEPLGHPSMVMTSPLALWLIAMDIDMIFNKSKCPQQNAVVERMQCTSGRWVELDKIKDLTHLHTRLEQEAQLQRQHLPVKRLGNKTRLEVFPQLETSRRIYREEDFDETKGYSFLSKKLYTRKVSSAGTIPHYQQVCSVAAKYKGEFVQVKFDLQTCSGHIFNSQAQIKTIAAGHLSKESIKNVTTCQRTYKSYCRMLKSIT